MELAVGGSGKGGRGGGGGEEVTDGNFRGKDKNRETSSAGRFAF